MDNKDWDILTTIYHEKNLSKASQKLYISQPALSYRINQLEKQFKITIFIRGKKFIKFTAEGEYLVQYAQKMKNNYIKLQDQLHDINETISGELRISASSNFARYKLPTILKRFHNLHPNIKFKIQTGPTSFILESMFHELNHIYIASGNVDEKYPKMLLEQNRICLISKDPIELNELPDLPRIKFTMESSAKITDENWWQENFSRPPLISMEVDKVETCKEMVLMGLGYGIVPEYLINNDMDKEQLHTLPLTHKDGTYLLRNDWAYYFENDLNLSFVNAFVLFLKDYYSID
ncbi:LysR family transcriptional regulator [Metabacillus endolithicus]|uniref:LysR family transcriptional regulator n=1 Tax=Metabacillus endolithicus TaxID=1535204 RepID=A0ABW5C3N9_9BACI|nr:LysR family transcriptional regulator [Metabacillus endolithicus]UPG62522.1 LysR family transcriptional regulator [Metabacillus endolithicus]